MRDPIAGSDWRSDGGWAIVLEGSARVVDTRIATFNTNFVIPNFRYTSAFGADLGRRITDRSESAFAGLTAIVQLNAGNVESNVVWVDHNRDGRITGADQVRGLNNNQYERLLFTEAGGTAVVGGQYIRWANMLWCR